MSKTTTVNWKAIAGKIRKEKCVLVLGPGAYHMPDGTTLNQKLVQYLDITHNNNIQKYYADDDFYLFSAGGGRAFTCEQIEDFYKTKKADATIQKLIEIPFHIILTVTPDKILSQTFQEAGFQYQFDFYKKRQEPNPIQTPQKELPLIYNLFGCIDDEESLILTHNDLYDYFKSIFSKRSMPEKLKQSLVRKGVNCFLFLGISFDKWYMQLLLRELEIHRNHEEFIRYATNQSLSKNVRTFCNEQFTIQFVDKQIPEFVTSLYDTCAAEGILREKNTDTRWNEIRTLVANGKLKKALEQLGLFTKGKELEDEVTGLSARFRRFNLKRLNGVLDSRDVPVQEAQIIKNLLELITEAETL